MGAIESMLLLPPSSADPWLSASGHGFLHICFIRAASCRYSGPGRVLTSWWEFMPYLSVTLGCWITKLEAGSVLGPTVMVGKVEYYNPDSKARLCFASRRLCFKKQSPIVPWSLVSLKSPLAFRVWFVRYYS